MRASTLDAMSGSGALEPTGCAGCWGCCEGLSPSFSRFIMKSGDVIVKIVFDEKRVQKCVGVVGEEAGPADVLAGGVCLVAVGTPDVVGKDGEVLAVGEGRSVGFGLPNWQIHKPFDAVTGRRAESESRLEIVLVGQQQNQSVRVGNVVEIDEHIAGCLDQIALLAERIVLRVAHIHAPAPIGTDGAYVTDDGVIDSLPGRTFVPGAPPATCFVT